MSSVDWEKRYQQADTPWDKGLPHPMIECWRGLDLAPGVIVVPGCGRGWDLRAWAMMFPEHQVLGIDLAESAVADAQKNCADLPNVRVIVADFFDHAHWHDLAAMRNSSISLIWEHTCFCAIHPAMRQTYAATVAALLKPGARLVGVFFTDIREDNGQGPPWNCSMDELQNLFGSHFVIDSPEWKHLTFFGRDGEERSLCLMRMD
jgi:hypothetical protein